MKAACVLCGLAAVAAFCLMFLTQPCHLAMSFLLAEFGQNCSNFHSRPDVPTSIMWGQSSVRKINKSIDFFSFLFRAYTVISFFLDSFYTIGQVNIILLFL